MDGSTKHAFWLRHNDTREDGFPVASVCMKSLQVDITGDIVNSDGMLQISARLVYTSVICKTNSRHKDLQQQSIKTQSGRPVGKLDPLLVWDTPEKGSQGLGESEINFDRYSGSYEGPIAVADFDVEDEQSSYSGVWCLLICRSTALMLECVDQERKIFRRLGLGLIVSEFWPYFAIEKPLTEVSLI
jgi:hypothetical protein